MLLFIVTTIDYKGEAKKVTKLRQQYVCNINLKIYIKKRLPSKELCIVFLVHQEQNTHFPERALPPLLLSIEICKMFLLS